MSKEKGLSQLFTPYLVRCLGSNVESWKVTKEGDIEIKVRGKPFDTLQSRTRLIGFFGSEHEFTLIAHVPVVPENRMNDRYRKLYRELKLMECEAEWKGVFRRKYFFKPFRGLKIIFSKYPSLSFDPTIKDSLESDESFNSLLQKTKPDGLWITLHSGYSKIIGFFEDVEETILDYFDYPEEIKWLIGASQVVETSHPTKEVVLDLYSILDFLSRKVVEITMEVEKRLFSNM